MTAGPAHATTSLGAWIQHSPDDINATDVPGFLTLSGNDSIVTPTLPFSVTIDGVAYNTVAISTNGWLEFGGNSAADTDPTNDCLPTSAHTRPFLAAYWDDLQTNGTAIRYGTVGSSPNRTFFIDARADVVALGGSDLLFYQVQIHEGSNLITVRYRSTENQANGQAATIGWQGAGGASASAQPIVCNGKVLDDNRADEGFSVDPSVTGRHVLFAHMAHSPDDISGFTSQSGNDSVFTPTMPFSITIGGTSYNTVAISTNGWLEFGGNTAANTTPNDFQLPTSLHTNPFLAAYWDDLQTQGTNLRYGTVGDPGNRVFIVDFQGDTVAAGSSDNISFQVQIHERSNLVNVKYRDTLGAAANGQLATIGFQGAGGASATAFPLTSNGKVLDDNRPNAQGWSVHLGSSVPVLHTTIAHSPDDISGFTTMTNDNQVGTASLPFSVVIDGVSYNTVAVSTNGWLELGGNTAADSTPSNTALPTSSHTNPFLAAFWDDLVPEGTNVRYGTVGQTGGRTFIVDWQAYVQPSPDSGNDAIEFQAQIHEGSNAINVQYRVTQRYASGQTATIGWQGAGGGSAQARVLTFNGRILDDNLPSAGWSVSPIPVCGNGLNESVAGETCDLGAGNGAATSCCSSTCTFKATGTTCRTATDVCDAVETCTGSSATCPANGFVAAGTECRAATGLCDVAETCTGSGAACPGDGVASAGTGCRGAAGVCDVAESCDGTNKACPADLKSTAVCRLSAGDCDAADSCDGVGNDCPADVVVTAGTQCRGVAGVCDVAEACDGISGLCPADAFVGAGTECRSAGGVCDVAEACTGSGPACPADVLVTAGTECRGAAGDCDLAEACDGSNVACPADVKSTAQCRASAGDCDVAESCDGASNTCPTDDFAPSTTTCRGAAGDCDVAESCTGTGAACPADVLVTAGTECRAGAGVCDVAESCTGASPTCPTDGFVSAGSECRASAGLCDVAESCTGNAATCPSDAVASSGTGCRASAGDCDLAETCDGVGTACPTDLKSTATCRGTAGDCDVAEVCTGSSNDCPSDVLATSGTQCRATAGDCDVAESCDGNSAACPTDDFLTAGTECRASAGDCDVAESCSGSAAACPTDDLAPAGTECRAAAGQCDVAETCTGNDVACPTDSVAGAFVQCRAAAGDCDLPESCDGAGTDCPADLKASAATACRASAGDCDVAEACDGSSDACPADLKQPATTECRASAGDCDVAESCDGVSASCPTDAKEPATTECRASAGDCDVAESCTGSSNACPTDAFAPSTTECRPASGVCDAAETCTGGSASCPADSGAPDNDGDGVCDAIDLCVDVADPTQPDGDSDGRGDACDPCTNTFNGGTFATKAKLVASKLLPASGDDKLKIKGFILLPTTPTIEPDVNGLRLLLETQDGTPIFDATLPPDAYSSTTLAGWRANGPRTKFLYKNAGKIQPLIEGIGKVSFGLSPKTPGLAKLSVSAKNGTYGPLAASDLPLRWTIVVDVPNATTGQCGESNYVPAECLLTGSGATAKCTRK